MASKCSTGRSLLASRLLIAAATLATASAQNISSCCDKAQGSCRSVCDKMSIEFASDTSKREESLHNIYRFCTPHSTEFWICMNLTIQEVVTGSAWWGGACCALARAPACRGACARAGDARALDDSCRRSDEIALYDCVHRQEDAQACCSQTQSLSCHEACHKVLWHSGNVPVDSGARDRAVDACYQSPLLLQCLRDLTASTEQFNPSKYLPCCHEASNSDCRSTCETIFRQPTDMQEISMALSKVCPSPMIHDAFWQCILRTDAPPDAKDLIPHDVAKLHCCQKATTINCKRLCLQTFNNDWQNSFNKLYLECLGDPLEMELTQCFEDVDSPCSLGCNGLTYCSQLNNRPTSLFRSCSGLADLDAHLAVAQRKDSGYVMLLGLELPLKNSTQCTSDVWKGVACALHVKPCTIKGHSSLLCMEDCLRLVSSCVDWARAPPRWNAAALCARLTPKAPAAPCVPLGQYLMPSTSPPSTLVSARESVSAACGGAPCNDSQVCAVNRGCLRSIVAADPTAPICTPYTCVDGCSLGNNSPYNVPIGAWVRVPMSGPPQKICVKICRCTHKGLSNCQPLPCITPDNCQLQDKIVPNGGKYYMECNACACAMGERVCAARACGRGGRALPALPCHCPPHHLPARTPRMLYPNACLAKCAGASDAEIEFGIRSPCAGVSCPRRHVCLPSPNVCLSRLQASCPQHVCVSISDCSQQPAEAACDTDDREHRNACHLVMAGSRLAYWGPCLRYCASTGTVCGVNGVTYVSECAAWAEHVSVDYIGQCFAVGPISDAMEPKCSIDRIICPLLKKKNCLGFTAPGACCPKCGGALRILYSKKQIDRALYGTNISSTVINLNNVLNALERHVNIAECALRGYLTIEMEIFVTVETLLPNPTDLQLTVCVLEAEKIADLINRESPLISSDLGLSALTYALIVHVYDPSVYNPRSGASCAFVYYVLSLLTLLSIYIVR